MEARRENLVGTLEVDPAWVNGSRSGGYHHIQRTFRSPH